MKTLRSDGMETRARLKAAAQRLFAQRGVDGVSVQEIVSEAGQRNNGSIHYHFGSKRNLLKELVLDGANIINGLRENMVDRLEAENAITIRSMVEALALPLLMLSEQTGQKTYIRMIANLQTNDRAFLRTALGDTWNTGYRRCLVHLKSLLPNLPAPILQQRLSLINIYGSAIWAAWEAAQDSETPNRFWSPEYSVSNVLDTLQATLEVEPSTSTIILLKQPQRLP